MKPCHDAHLGWSISRARATILLPLHSPRKPHFMKIHIQHASEANRQCTLRAVCSSIAQLLNCCAVVSQSARWRFQARFELVIDQRWCRRCDYIYYDYYVTIFVSFLLPFLRCLCMLCVVCACYSCYILLLPYIMASLMGLPRKEAPQRKRLCLNCTVMLSVTSFRTGLTLIMNWQHF